MDNSSSDYWASVAQVIPFFAVGLVVEWRTLVARSGGSVPWPFRAVTSAFTFVCLAVLGLGEMTALNALRDEDVADYWPSLIAAGIAASIGVLVFSPALELLVRSNAEIPALLFSRHPILRWRFYKANRQILRRMQELDRRLEQAQGETERADRRIQALRPRNAALIAELDAIALDDLNEEGKVKHRARRAELQHMEDELRELEKEQEARQAAGEALADEARRIKKDYLAEYAEASAELRKFLAQEREAWLKAIRDFDATQSKIVGSERASGGEGASPRS